MLVFVSPLPVTAKSACAASTGEFIPFVLAGVVRPKREMMLSHHRERPTST